MTGSVALYIKLVTHAFKPIVPAFQHSKLLFYQQNHLTLTSSKRPGLHNCNDV